MPSENASNTPPIAQNVLLSIDPEHAEAILSGEKRYEYRRVAPAKDPPYRFVLYATAPVKAAVGVMWCHTKKTGPPTKVVRNTVQHTPHDKGELLGYFGDVVEANALRADAYRRFEEPVPRSHLEEIDAVPSQNFRYIGSCEYRPETVEPAGVMPDGE